MRIDEIKAEIAEIKNTVSKFGAFQHIENKIKGLETQLAAELTASIPLDELETLCEAWRGGNTVIAITPMKTMPGSCAECKCGRQYGFVGDVHCRITGDYYTGNVRPPHKERPDECPLVFLNAAAALKGEEA